jgi:hypothetical protein
MPPVEVRTKKRKNQRIGELKASERNTDKLFRGGSQMKKAFLIFLKTPPVIKEKAFGAIFALRDYLWGEPVLCKISHSENCSGFGFTVHDPDQLVNDFMKLLRDEDRLEAYVMYMNEEMNSVESALLLTSMKIGIISKIGSDSLFAFTCQVRESQHIYDSAKNIYENNKHKHMQYNIAKILKLNLYRRVDHFMKQPVEVQCAIVKEIPLDQFKLLPELQRKHQVRKVIRRMPDNKLIELLYGKVGK